MFEFYCFLLPLYSVMLVLFYRLRLTFLHIMFIIFKIFSVFLCTDIIIKSSVLFQSIGLHVCVCVGGGLFMGGAMERHITQSRPCMGLVSTPNTTSAVLHFLLSCLYLDLFFFRHFINKLLCSTIKVCKIQFNSVLFIKQQIPTNVISSHFKITVQFKPITI